jgi:hypothetical protein
MKFATLGNKTDSIQKHYEERSMITVIWYQESFVGQITEILHDDHGNEVGIMVSNGRNSTDDYLNSRQISICCIDDIIPADPTDNGFCKPN